MDLLGKCMLGVLPGLGFGRKICKVILSMILSASGGLADASPQKAPCFLLDCLADAGHHGHHGHRNPERGWKHLCEPGGSCGLPREGRALVHCDSVVCTFSQGHQRQLPHECMSGGPFCLGHAREDGICLAPPTALGLGCLHQLTD